jgi:hypothetical protein
MSPIEKVFVPDFETIAFAAARISSRHVMIPPEWSAQHPDQRRRSIAGAGAVCCI